MNGRYVEPHLALMGRLATINQQEIKRLFIIPFRSLEFAWVNGR